MEVREEDDPFQGVANREQDQPGNDDERAADGVEDREYQKSNEGDSKGELDEEEHGSFRYVFMLSFGVVSD